MNSSSSHRKTTSKKTTRVCRITSMIETNTLPLNHAAPDQINNKKCQLFITYYLMAKKQVLTQLSLETRATSCYRP